MSTEKTAYDVVVLGAGPGGYVAAIRAAQLGGRVAVVEREEVGGVCLNKGCIPTKVLLRVAELQNSIRKADRLGLNVGSLTVDAQRVMAKKAEVVKTLTRGVRFLLSKNKVDLVKGEGRLSGSNEVEVTRADGTTSKLLGRAIIIATGSRVAELPLEGSNLALSTDDVLEISSFPRDAVIIGGGASGVEFASIFNAFEARVTVIEILSNLLPLEDEDVGVHLRRSFTSKGIKVLTSSKVTRISARPDARRILRVETPDGPLELETELVLITVGRKPNSEDLGLEALGVKTDRGRIVVNERMETSVAGVYAIGDVVGKYAFAHVASAEGVVAAENAMGKMCSMDYAAVPRCIFSLPEVAAVGLTEKQAVESGHKVAVGKFPLSASGRALTLDDTDGFVKVIADAESREILGLHIVGPMVTELIPEGVLAMKLEATAEDVTSVIHAHPTLAEAVKEALLDIEKKAIHK